ncbi:MAG: hypothetical protein LBE84_12015 [Planctomycetota bacterium]|nr:hypothetical protein [Planctomycetota bacterium]
MTPDQMRERIEYIAVRDGRYAPAAFFFINDVVTAAVKWLKSGEMSPNDPAALNGRAGSHISCRELLEAMRRMARERWGCLARLVLENWGVASTDDVGEIVFMMVEDEELQWQRRECDTREEFREGYDFKATFDAWGDD